MNEKEKIVQGGCLVEIVVYYRNKVIWELVNDHVVEGATDHDEMGLWGIDFFFDRNEKGVGVEGFYKFTYLLMLIKIWPGYWKTQSKRMNQKVDKDTGKALVIYNGQYKKVCWFSSNEFWKNIGCLV